ncbi:hypothetical protein XM52_15140 [Roseovarius indicus]|uniref:Uncharacterized protein n=1 Tax=Roseovarius indicus TaxID=540747 RepID=A0A0T5P766_9RHOB|nr:hypothetical protein XM52_15140 [Roseovarius indicus]
MVHRKTKKDPQDRILRAAKLKADHLSRSCDPDVWNTNRLFGGECFMACGPEGSNPRTGRGSGQALRVIATFFF